MRTPNRFVPARPRTRAAGATAIELGSMPPAQWLTWLASTRIAYTQSQNPQQPYESAQAYANRIRSLVAAQTTKSLSSLRTAGATAIENSALIAAGRNPNLVAAFGSPKYGYNSMLRPAGDAVQDALNGGTTQEDWTTGSGGKTANDSPGTSSNKSGMSDATITTIGNDVAGILGRGADIVIAAMNGSDHRAVAQIQADALTHLQELRNQQAATTASTDPGVSAAITRQIQSLQAAIAAMSANTGMSTTTLLAIGAGGLILVGGLLYFLMRRPSPRHNPVLYRASKKGHHHLEPYRFVSARHLRKMQHSK